MKIKYLLTFVLISVLSCDYNNIGEIKNKTTLNNEELAMTGIWTLTASYDGQNMINFNVCPLLKFEKDGYGTYGSPNQVLNNILIDDFKWKIDSNKLKINYTFKNSNRLFNDSIYNIDIDSETVGLRNLIISNLKGNETYYLSR